MPDTILILGIQQLKKKSCSGARIWEDRIQTNKAANVSDGKKHEGENIKQWKETGSARRSGECTVHNRVFGKASLVLDDKKGAVQIPGESVPGRWDVQVWRPWSS